MEPVAVVVCLALLQYATFMFRAGNARGRYDVAAPATSGHPMFERHLRVQENTIEQLVIFLPGVFLFGRFVQPWVAAGLGLLFLVGRALYARAYVSDPAKRGPGFLITLSANAILLVGGLIGALLGCL